MDKYCICGVYNKSMRQEDEDDWKEILKNTSYQMTTAHSKYRCVTGSYLVHDYVQ